MPLILNRNQVLEVFEEAEEREWTIPAFNAENLTTIEAVLSAVLDYGKHTGEKDLPVIIGITNKYPDRPQSTYYSHTGEWEIGLKLFLKDLEILTSDNSPFRNLKVLIHLDHIQWDLDSELLKWDMNMFSSIMYDASTLPIKENISRTSDFVEKNKNKILIEGACDEISHEGESSERNFTSADEVSDYFLKTGVDIIVTNLGTEHRSSSSRLKYNSGLARSIKEKIGNRLCLHGSSSVSIDEMSKLFDDGICKVNIWTALERESSPVLLEEMLKNTSRITGIEKAKRFLSDKLVGINSDLVSGSSVEYFTTKYRQKIIFGKMKKIVGGYLELFYK